MAGEKHGRPPIGEVGDIVGARAHSVWGDDDHHHDADNGQAAERWDGGTPRIAPLVQEWPEATSTCAHRMQLCIRKESHKTRQDLRRRWLALTASECGSVVGRFDMFPRKDWLERITTVSSRLQNEEICRIPSQSKPACQHITAAYTDRHCSSVRSPELGDVSCSAISKIGARDHNFPQGCI